VSAPGKRPDMVVHEDQPLNAEPPRGALAGATLVLHHEVVRRLSLLAPPRRPARDSPVLGCVGGQRLAALFAGRCADGCETGGLQRVGPGAEALDDDVHAWLETEALPLAMLQRASVLDGGALERGDAVFARVDDALARFEAGAAQPLVEPSRLATVAGHGVRPAAASRSQSAIVGTCPCSRAHAPSASTIESAVHSPPRSRQPASSSAAGQDP
jgi:hypothetical protein